MNTSDPTQSDEGPLPLVLGVTGHRDLRPEDRPALKERVRAIIAELRQRYPSTPLILLSPLAEGADQLVAEEALELGVGLVVPLPFKGEIYEQDFKTPASHREFKELLEKAERRFSLGLVEGNTDEAIRSDGEPRNKQYAQVGAYMAANSQILIALWDGRPSDKVGGTAQVVKYRLEGIPEPYAPPKSPLDPLETGPVYHIVTPRISNPEPIGNSLTLRKLFPRGNKNETEAEAAHRRILKRFDTFNSDDLRLAPVLRKARNKAKGYLFSREEADRLPALFQTILDWYAVADALALHFQRLTLRTLLALVFLAFCAAGCYQIYAAGQSEPRILGIVYLVTLCAAYAVFLWTWWRDYHNKYLDYRALAEGMRVYLFWRLAGLREGVADHYLRKQRGELDWIRQALRVWSIPRRLDTAPTPVDSRRMQLVLEKWVKDQAGFFTRAAWRDYKKERIIRWLGYVFLLSGIFLAVVKVFIASEHPLLVAMSLVLVIAALLHFYGKTMAYSEHAKQYGRMQLVFSIAEKALRARVEKASTRLDGKNLEDALEIIRELGKEALAENGDWALLHRERPPEMLGTR